MTEAPNNDEELDDLRMENEIKKIKLSLEHGSHFSESDGNSDLDPRIEAEFLDYIDQFEKAYHDCKQIQVYEFIGNPEFRKTEEIPDEEIQSELEKMMLVMNKNGVYLDTLCEVDERVLYQFITEELFAHEMDDMRVSGMMLNFIYEEFHPNHEYDIRNHSCDFIKSFLDKESGYYTTFLTKEAEKGCELKNFRDAYTAFSLENFEIISLVFEEEKSEVTFNIKFTGTIEGSSKIQSFSGEGKLELLYLYDFWCIQAVEFPSVSSIKN